MKKNNKKMETLLGYKESMEQLNKKVVWYKRIYYFFYRTFYKMVGFPREIKWFIQRGKNGYAKCDVWGLGGYLSEWLPKAIRDLKKNCNGCQVCLFDRKRKGNECWKWEEILEKMAQGFDAINKIDNSYLWKGKRYEELKKKQDEGMNLFVKYFRNLWD